MATVTRSVLRGVLRDVLSGATAISSPTLLTYASRIAQLGDSITQYGAALSTSLLSFSNAGELETAASLKGNFNIDIWGSDSATNPGWFGGDMGIAGQTLTGIGLRLPDAIGLMPDALIIAGGTNDNVGSGTVAATAAAYTGMATTAHNAGVKHVFIRSIWPKGPTQSVGSTPSDQRAYNALLKAFCDANPTWCHYVNIFDAVTNADGTPKTGMLNADDLHPSALGGYTAGTAMLAAIEAVMDNTKNSSWLVDNFWATGNIITSGSLPGTVAASGTGISGNLPTGWTAALSATPTSTVAFSLVANPDTGGQSLVMDIVPGSGTGSDVLTISLPSVTPTASQWYKPWMEFEVGAGSRNPQLEIINGVVNPDNPVTSVRTLFGDLASVTTGKVKAAAPPIQSRATATVPKIILTIDRGRAAYQTKVHRVYMGPMTDPHITWGQTTLPVNSVLPSVSGTPGVGNVLTVNPGTWSGLTSTNTSSQSFQYNLYRDGVFVSSTYSSGNLSYTQVAADGGATLWWTVGAANMAKGRSATSLSPSVNVPNPAWKSEYDFIADTHKTSGTTDGSSTATLTTVRATAGYGYRMTTLYPANTPKRGSLGLVVEPIVDYKLFPTLPDNAGNWVYSAAVCTPGGGAVGPEGTIVSSRIVMSSAAGYARRTVTGSANYRSAKAIVKGTAGQQVTLSYTPGQASTPNTSFLHTFTGGWDVIDVPNILAGNSSMVFQLTNVAGQSSLTFDVVHCGVSIVGTGSATAAINTPFPLTTAAASSAADAISLTIPASSTDGVFTFDDGSKQRVAVSAGTYNIPTTLSRRLITSFKII
jgi:hypothetical protein